MAAWVLGGSRHRVPVQWLNRPEGGKVCAGSIAAVNVELHVHPDWEATLKPAADALAVALYEMGIVATPTRYNCESANDGSVHILIGPKA